MRTDTGPEALKDREAMNNRAGLGDREALENRLERSVSRLAQLHADRALLDAQLMDEYAECWQIADALDGGNTWASERDLTFRSVSAEIATRIRISDRIIQDTMDTGAGIVRSFPHTLEALRAGDIWAEHATIITTAGQFLDDPIARGDYETAVLEQARKETPTRLRAIAKRLAHLFSETSIDERHQEARKTRCVRVYNKGDGLAELSAIIPAAEAFAIKDRLSQMAHKLDDPDRSTAEMRADLLINLLLHGQPNTHIHPGTTACTGAGVGTHTATCTCASTCSITCSGTCSNSCDKHEHDKHEHECMCMCMCGGHVSAGHAASDHECNELRCGLLSGIAGRISITLPALGLLPPEQVAKVRADNTLTGLAGLDGAADLNGYGPIDTPTARRIIGGAKTWLRLFIDPIKAAVTSVDRYRPSQQQRDALAVRDMHCRFPGCILATYTCDLDHTIDAAHGGPTANTNLAHLCRRHHMLKHHGNWDLEQGEHGDMTWTSPLGKRYTEDPPTSSMFLPPPDRTRYAKPEQPPPPTEAEWAEFRANTQALIAEAEARATQTQAWKDAEQRPESRRTTYSKVSNLPKENMSQPAAFESLGDPPF